MIFETKVQGIPCQCQVDHFTPGRPMKIYGTGLGDAHPPEYPEFQFTLLDRKGYQAHWLENKMSDNDKEQLFEEYKAGMLADKYGYEY